MENIKDEVWREWHKKWEADAAKHLGKEKLTFDEKRIAYYAWREAIEICNAEIEASNVELRGALKARPSDQRERT